MNDHEHRYGADRATTRLLHIYLRGYYVLSKPNNRRYQLHEVAMYLKVQIHLQWMSSTQHNLNKRGKPLCLKLVCSSLSSTTKKPPILGGFLLLLLTFQDYFLLPRNLFRGAKLDY